MSCCKHYFDTFQYTHVAIGEIMDVVNELGKGVLLDLYEKYHICVCVGWDSVVSIATHYELDSLGIESW